MLILLTCNLKLRIISATLPFQISTYKMQSPFRLFICISLLGLHANLLAEQFYDTIPLQPTGIFFEDLGSTVFYHDTWKIITTIKLADPSLPKSYILESEKALENLCINKNNPLLQINRVCEADKNTIVHLARRIEYALEHIELSNHARQKRSLIDAGGKLAKFLFGTMDQEDATNIYNRIAELETNSKSSLELLQEQTSVIKSNFEALRSPIENITRELEEIKKFVNETSSLNEQRITQLEQKSELLLTRMAINEFINAVTIKLQEWERQLMTLMSILMSLNAGKLHPAILSYRQIASHLNKISEQYQTHDILNDPFLLQQLAEVYSFHLQDMVFVKLVIPLPRLEEYKLKKVYPLTIKVTEKIQGTYDVRDDYLALDKGQNNFILMQQHDFLTNCHKRWVNTTANAYVCKLTTPILTSPTSNCIALLYKNWSEAAQHCEKITTSLEHDLIVQLTKANNWIYDLREEREIKIQCRNFKTIIRRGGQAILRLYPSCQAQIADTQIIAENTFDSEIQFEQTKLTPSFIFDPSLSEMLASNATNSLRKPQVLNSNAHKLWLRQEASKIVRLESHIKEEQAKRTQLKFLTQQKTLTGTLIGIGCIFVIGVIFGLRGVRRCNRCRKTQVSAPTIVFKKGVELEVSSASTEGTHQAAVSQQNPPPCTSQNLQSSFGLSTANMNIA